jgi:hypothetical protein
MLSREVLHQKLRYKHSRCRALEIMQDLNVFVLAIDLNVGNFSVNLSLIYDWICENITDFDYLSNYALAHIDLHSVDGSTDSIHLGFETFLLIPDSNERMMFKLKFAELIKTL